jgi:hypothetical protein
MSTDRMTYATAAKHLGITERSVRNYVRRGFLQAKSISGMRGKFLSPTEVEELRVLRMEQEGAGPVSRQEVLLLTSKVRRLEYSMSTVLRLLDAKDAPLGMTPSYAKELHAACVTQLSRTGWAVEEINPWVEIFLRIDEEDLTVVAKSTEDSKPWVALLRLCLAMSTSVVSEETYQTSLALQDVHRSLAEGRRRLRAAAVIFEGSKGHATEVSTLLSQETPLSVVDVLDRVLSIKK